MKLLFPIVLICLFFNYSLAQSKVYEIDARHLVKKEVKEIGMSATNPQGIKLSVNNQYFEKNNKPWIPLMGEMHYNRVPQQYWEDAIMQMKSAGLSVISTYVFWNEQEPEKGVWDWKGNRNLRLFLTLCKENGMYVWLRIGPYAHGEQLNGGFPEWIEKMKGKRTNDPVYLKAVTKFFDQIGDQTKGFYFKEGGPVIGVQLENEYASGQLGHISMLKKIAIAAGIRPVYWSVTGNTVFDDNKMQVIPLQGAYPYRGWEKAGGGPTRDFLYGDDQWIMTRSLGKVYYDITKFPKGFCELGCGSQMTFKNRFIVEPKVIEALLQNEIGRGVNMIGYYMFHGGTQTPGLEEPGLPMTYDFQAPISEFGLIRKSYKDLKILHHFINDFGTELAPMQVVEPKNPVRDPLDTTDLRYVARVNGNTGFLFLCNTQVRVHMPDKQVTMKMKLLHETITYPSVLLKGQTTAILPFNLNINNALLKYATVQPLARFNKGKVQYVFFTEIPGMKVQLAFDKTSIKSLAAKNWKQDTSSEKIILIPEDHYDPEISIVSSTGQHASIIILTRQQAENSWQTKIDHQQRLIISKADLMLSDNKIECRQLDSPDISFRIFPRLNEPLYYHGNKVAYAKKGIFQYYFIHLKEITPKVTIDHQSKSTMIVHTPDHLPSMLSDIVLKINYLGGNANALVDGNIVTDNMFNGTPWRFGLKRYLKAASEKGIEFQVMPWSDSITGVAEHWVQEIKRKGEGITNIKVIPQYDAIFTLGK